MLKRKLLTGSSVLEGRGGVAPIRRARICHTCMYDAWSSWRPTGAMSCEGKVSLETSDAIEQSGNLAHGSWDELPRDAWRTIYGRFPYTSVNMTGDVEHLNVAASGSADLPAHLATQQEDRIIGFCDRMREELRLIGKQVG